MNAIIALCHFCESHGPSANFCTQTLRDTKINELIFNFDLLNCAACNSIGNTTGMLSKDVESSANFLSSQFCVIPDTVNLVKQACVRSLSCEVSSNKDGGFVFFGDAIRGHVLSHTFRLRDAKARGFFRLFSIIVLMKDKLFLLNIQPFLSENLLIISKELQSYASAIYLAEQTLSSERANRLNAGQANITQVPRSLSQLTGEEHIFAQLHSHFSWILWAGTRCLTETVTTTNIPVWLGKETDETNFSIIKFNNDNNSLTPDEQNVEIIYNLRELKTILRSDFLTVVYCACVGIQIILRGPQIKSSKFMKCFKKLIPEAMHKLTKTDCVQYLPPNDNKILSVSFEVPVPQPCAGICRLEYVDDESDDLVVKWLGELPSKLPSLITKIIKAMDEKLFTDLVLDKHLKVLVEEWKNKVLCLKRIHSNQEVNKLKKILGILQQDQPLINYWSNYL